MCQDVKIISPAALKAMQQHVRRAWERAQALHKPVLLRLHATFGSLVPSLVDADPWHIWQQQAPATRPCMLFYDGRDNGCAAAWGQVQYTVLQPARRFGQARTLCAALLEQSLDVAWEPAPAPLDVNVPLDVDAPLAFVAFAYAAGAASQTGPEAAAWQAWGGGQVYVPEVLVYRRGTAPLRLVLSTYVHPAASPAAPLAVLQQLWQNTLQRAAAASRHAHTQAHTHATPQPYAAVPSAVMPPRWGRRVARAQAAMAQGNLAKVVLARHWQLRAPSGQQFAPWATLQALRAQQPQSLCFALGHPQGSVFLGATPEILVQVFGRQLTTQAVAGTTARHATAPQDAALATALQHSAKNLQEHALVVQALRQALQPWCQTLALPPLPRLFSLPDLQHLETPIRATLRQAGQILTWVERLHPTPAVGGLPGVAAQQFLKRYEKLTRGLYAAPVGWLTAASDGVFAVAIRSVLFEGTHAWAYAGAGIVPASEASSEWHETNLKLRTVARALHVMPADGVA